METTTKTSMLLILVCVGVMSMPIVAMETERFLPVSSKSEAAKKAYHEAVSFIANARIPEFKAKIAETISLDNDFFMAYAHIAILEVSEKKSIIADKLIDKALDTKSENFTESEKIIYHLMVKLCDDRKSKVEKPDLKSFFDQLAIKFPNTIEVYDMASNVLRFVCNDYAAALGFTERLIAIAPDYGPSYNNMGYSYMEAGKMDKAKEAFKKYLRLSPYEANAHDSMGNFYIEAGHYDEAVLQYEKAVGCGMRGARVKAEEARILAIEEELIIPAALK